MAKDLFNSCSSEMISHDWSMLQIAHGTSGNLINDEFLIDDLLITTKAIKLKDIITNI